MSTQVGKTTPVASNVFVFGDICKTSLNELKNIPSIKFLAPFIVENIEAQAKGQAPAKSMPAKLPVFVAISVGNDYGMYVVNKNVNGGDGMGKGKFEFTENYIKMYGGAHDIIKGQKAWLAGEYEKLSKEL